MSADCPRGRGILLSVSRLTLTVHWSSWKEQAFIDAAPVAQRRNGTNPERHSCFTLFCSRKGTRRGQHERSAAQAAWVGRALSGERAGFVFALTSRDPDTTGIRPHSGAGRMGPGHWHRWGQLERVLIRLVNLSGPLAGNRQGASGRLFGVPLIVTITLAPDVT